MYVMLVTCPEDDAERVARRLTEERLAVVLASLGGGRSFWRVGGEDLEEQRSTVLVLLAKEGNLEALAAEAQREVAGDRPPLPVVALTESGGLARFLAQAEAELSRDAPEG